MLSNSNYFPLLSQRGCCGHSFFQSVAASAGPFSVSWRVRTRSKQRSRKELIWVFPFHHSKEHTGNSAKLFWYPQYVLFTFNLRSHYNSLTSLYSFIYFRPNLCIFLGLIFPGIFNFKACFKIMRFSLQDLHSVLLRIIRSSKVKQKIMISEFLQFRELGKKQLPSWIWA